MEALVRRTLYLRAQLGSRLAVSCHLWYSLILSFCGFFCYSGMFEDSTFVYMIEPLELTHDEVSLTGTSVSLWCFTLPASLPLNSKRKCRFQSVLIHIALLQT